MTDDKVEKKSNVAAAFGYDPNQKLPETPKLNQSEGGDGLASSITGSSVTRGGGGSGNADTGGAGGGGSSRDSGTANTGGGGSGSSRGGNPGAGPDNGDGGSGGSGVVILRIPTANYSGTTSGSPTITTDGSHKVLVFNSSGSYTA